MRFSDKNIVFIISAGRTGTKYFGSLLSNIIKDCFSVHEPDIFSGFNKKLLEQIKYFGLYNMVIGRALRKAGIRNLSENYLAGKLTRKELKHRIKKHRDYYYSTIAQDLIIESYYGWYGCIPAIKEIFPNYKIIAISRDPKEWIRSNMNWEQWYGKRDFASKLKFGRLNPKLIGDQEYQNKWDEFSRFEKLCWAYRTIYTRILMDLKDEPNSKVFKFEDLFYHQNRYDNLDRLINFAVDFNGKKFNYTVPSGVLEKKVHENTSTSFPSYEYWDSNLKEQFWAICKEIRHELGY